ncbi:hypothetical protein TNCV_1224911 [Trichonephila clavipes]|nr:hypothetical protein TNCV_1224911 [Trichonephila clavipes]
MPLHHHRRQYEQLSEFERGKIIRMMEAEWSSCREDRHIIRYAHIEPTSSLTVVQTQEALSLRTLCLPESSQDTWLMDIWYRGALTCATNHTHSPMSPFGVVLHTTRLNYSGMEPGCPQRLI